MNLKIQIVVSIVLMIVGFIVKFSSISAIANPDIKSSGSLLVLGGSIWATLAIRKLKGKREESK